MAEEKKEEIKAEVKPEVKPEVKAETKAEVKPEVKTESAAPVQAAAVQAPAQEAKAAEAPKKEKPANCASCNKSIKKKRWYYRAGKFYCTKRCWKTGLKKEANAEAAAKAQQ